jgi:Cys-tRNA(Pro)/Cys-tRNA(Cys) deacylase
MAQKTNAIHMLDRMNIEYQLREYDVDESDLSAEHVAETLGIAAEQLYKTLVLYSQNDDVLVALIPGNASLDLKKIAKVSGYKNCRMLPLKDLLAVTGYIRGGCSPIGMKKQFPTYIEELATLENRLIISAGKRGLQLIINSSDLQKITQAEFADLCS